MDTIFAPATAPGRAGVAIYRLSGPQAAQAAIRLCGSINLGSRALRSLRDSQGVVIDQALVLHFHAGQSFTGEEVVELHTHGSIIVQKLLLEELSNQPELRLAQPGEFTRRAFENGRMDLSQVEGLADLIEAETASQHRQALRSFDGALREKAERWHDKLIEISSLFAAAIDFTEEDLPDDVINRARSELVLLRDDLIGHVKGSNAAMRIREGFHIAVIGEPNVGKSSLINRIAGRDVSIVSEFQGTTRDIIEVHTDVRGYSVTFIDTAGLRDTDDPIEAIGVAKARQHAETADIRLILYEPGTYVNAAEDDIVVQAKSDIYPTDSLSISAVTGAGIENLLELISDRLVQMTSGSGLITNERQKNAASAGLADLTLALEALELSDDLSIVAAQIDSAARNMSYITGRFNVEDVLGRVFESFCVGK